MPAAAVIPAPKAYAHVVAVEKLVVGNKLFAERAPVERPRVALETKDGVPDVASVPKGPRAALGPDSGRPAWPPFRRRLHVESRSQVALKKLKRSGQVDAKKRLAVERRAKSTENSRAWYNGRRPRLRRRRRDVCAWQ